MSWSSECCDIYGRVNGEFDGSLDDFLAHIHPEDRERVRTKLSAAVSERTAYACDFRVVRPGGDLRWVTNKGRAFFDGQSRPLRMIGTITDISFRKEAELKLLEADRQKNEFLATLAHELRNPLAPIRNAVQLLLISGIDSSEFKWAGDVIERQLRQMTRLVDDLLEVSRITTGKLEIRKENLDLAKVVQSAVETSLPLIEQNGHQLAVTLPGQPVMVNADMIRLAQVFSNLLNNAAKYTDSGGRIEFSVAAIGAQAVVSVKDSGIGIPADMLPHIFEMFTQVDRHLHRSQGGLGIGLTLVKRLVEMHGGSIEARSLGSDQGSEFLVRLPVVSHAIPATNDPPAAKQITNGAALRILVVDDNEDSAVSLGKLLKILGNDIRIAHDGLAAIEAAEGFRPAVMLLDIGMPKLNGYDVCRNIRQQPWGGAMVLIALTGWGQEDDRQRTKEAGFDYHLVKPVEADNLIKLLAQVKAST